MATSSPSLPTTINVGPHPYTVTSDQKRCEDLGVRGQTDTDELRILINPSLPPSMLRETVLHEALHALLDLQGVNVSDKPLLTDDEHEQLVRGLAPLLLDMLRRNPNLTAWLLTASNS